MMNDASLSIRIHRACFIPGHVIFQNTNLTRERTVQYYELVFFSEDGGYFSANGKKYHIKAGTGRLYRPGDRVFSYRFGDVYAVHFAVENEDAASAFFREIPTFFALADMKEEIGFVKNIVDSILKGNDMDAVSHLCGLLLCIKEQVGRKTETRTNETVQLSKAYMDANFSENISLTSLAKRYFVHPVYLQRIFKKETGMSPAEYLLSLRMKQAKMHLISDNISIEEIACKTGFCNASYFIKVFKTAEGITPRAYREQMRSFREL